MPFPATDLPALVGVDGTDGGWVVMDIFQQQQMSAVIVGSENVFCF